MVLPKNTSFNPSDFVDPSTITRVLILSYFVALALTLIDGANITLLAAPFMSDTAARLTMRGVVLTLSAMILFRVFRRPAALVLAMVVFWPSYMMMYAGGDVSAFWRDLALIGALLLTSHDRQQPETFEDDHHGAEDHMLDLAVEAQTTQASPAPFDDEIYREDLNLVRSA